MACTLATTLRNFGMLTYALNKGPKFIRAIADGHEPARAVMKEGVVRDVARVALQKLNQRGAYM